MYKLSVVRLLAVILLFSAQSALASSSYLDEQAGLQGIITPRVATDIFQTSAVARDLKGNMVVCPTYIPGVRYSDADARRPVCETRKGKSSWRYPQQLPPAGKEYVGFRMQMAGDGYVFYEFFWR